MDNIERSAYFFYGFPECKNNKCTQYGLWEPVTDRLVLVGPSDESLKLTALLFSGKLSLFVVRIDTASNFTPTIVDNSCCTDWTIANKGDIRISRHIGDLIGMPITQVTQLIPSAVLSEPELIVDNREFLLAAHYWSAAESNSTWPKRKLDGFSTAELYLSSAVNLPMPVSQTYEDIKRVHDIIFTETDFTAAKRQIKEIINPYLK